MSSANTLSKNLTFMRWLLKRRRLIAIAIIFCICFLVYQLLSLKELNVQMFETNKDSLIKHKQQDMQMSSVIAINDHIIRPETHSNSYNNYNNYEKQLINEKKNYIKEDQLKDTTNDDNFSSEIVMIGVLPKFYSLYKKSSDSFRCLLSGEEIPYSYINDDYCDCSDGSDEPSTNACPLNKFYCLANSGSVETYIASHKVNDGICDCCDGSDETRSVMSPIILTSSQLRTMKSSRKLVSSPPCPNRC